MKNNEEQQISNKTLLLFGFGMLIHWLGKQITRLTKYFPFSLVSDRWYLHYKNREITQAWDILTDGWFKSGVYFRVLSADKDENFIYFHGRFNRNLKDEKINKFKSYLDTKIGEASVFLRKQENNSYNISIIRKSLVGIK